MIRVRRAGPGIHLDIPDRIAHLACDEIGITLTRDEAFDLLEKLRCTLAADTPEGKASQRQSVPRGE